MSHSLKTFEEFVHTHSFHQTTWHYLITPLDRSAQTYTTVPIPKAAQQGL